MLENIISGLVVIALGATFSIFGYQFARFLIPIWAFFLGLILGAATLEFFTGDGFLGTSLAWIVGLAAGVGLALIAYRFFTLGLVIFAASVGGILIGFVLLSLGIDSTLVLAILTIAAAIGLGLAAYRYKVGKYLVVLITAAAGATGIVNGILLILGRLSMYDINTKDTLSAAFSSSILWLVLWVALVAVGAYIQIQYTAYREIMGLPEELQDSTAPD